MLLLTGLALLSLAPLQDDTATKEAAEKPLEFTLENIFPEKSLFGPSASSAAFSHDGRYAAWLYRPYVERRHGSDLWLHDFTSGETRRVTSVSVLAPFQAETREVADDRIAKARKASGKKDEAEEGGTWAELVERAQGSKEGAGADSLSLADVVGEDDADAEKAPRYSGVASFTFSPTAAELLFTSRGDVYRLLIGEDGFERLTRTRTSERNVQYLPDGSGYTYQANDALVRVRFDDSFVEQLDPRLPDGQSMRSYRLSPDGTAVAFTSSNGVRDASRTVSIATYNDRFMRVREVPRTVSDDAIGKARSAIYLYRLPTEGHDDGLLVKVIEQERSGPRDVLRVPDWAPDSSKVVFSAFEQDSGHVGIYEASIPEDAKSEKPGDAVDEDARLVYRFLHDGGPNTPRMIEPQYLADSRRVALLTEQSGFRHVHLLDPVYQTLEQLTRGRFEAYPMDLPAHREWMPLLATKEHPSQQDLYRLDFDSSELTRLTTESGQYSRAAVSPDGRRALATFTTYGALRELVLVDVEKGTQTALTDSHPERTKKLLAATPEVYSYTNRHGHEIQGLLWKPADMNEGEKRPLLLYVYGGPLGTRKQVTLGNYGSDAYLFAQYMAREHGYVTCTIDPRGMSGYGALFEKANFEQVGKPQVEDLVDGVEFLVANHGVDPERVGMHGWSFGGFQTQMCLYTAPETFTCGIAGAGPTEWENYNSWYSTGTIGESRAGQPDLEKFSLLPLAKNLEGELLLVHGMEDSNVLYQDTVRVYAALLEAGKETLVELFLDPKGGHGLGGFVKRLNRYRKYEEFLLRNLGSGATQ